MYKKGIKIFFLTSNKIQQKLAYKSNNRNKTQLLIQTQLGGVALDSYIKCKPLNMRT